ncbi:MAG: sulfotransferase [Pseudomonadota bacterium]
MSRRRHPDFIGIGAARSGSTWFAKVIAQHPSVWVPHRKELKYFSREPKYLSSSYLSEPSILKRLLTMGRHSKKFRSELMRATARNLRHWSAEERKWDLKYYFREANDDWYLDLFSNRPEPVVGEFSPDYALLDDADAERMVDQLPTTKFIYIMRDPIDRAWSSIRYHERRTGARLTEMSNKQILEYLSNPSITGRSNFLQVVKRWRRLLPEERFLTAFYDDIQLGPELLMKRTCLFLGLDEEPITSMNLNARINESFEKEIPCQIRLGLCQYYIQDLNLLARELGGVTEGWLQRAEETLSNHT